MDAQKGFQEGGRGDKMNGIHTTSLVNDGGSLRFRFHNEKKFGDQLVRPSHLCD